MTPLSTFLDDEAKLRSGKGSGVVLCVVCLKVTGRLKCWKQAAVAPSPSVQTTGCMQQERRTQARMTAREGVPQSFTVQARPELG